MVKQVVGGLGGSAIDLDPALCLDATWSVSQARADTGFTGRAVKNVAEPIRYRALED